MFFADRPRLMLINIELIDPPAFSTARQYDRESMGRLAGSIRENGMICPLIVARTGRRFRLVAGARRLRAAKLIGMSKLPCVALPSYNASDALTASLAENLEREPLHFFEQAAMIREILKRGEIDRLALSEKLTMPTKTLREKLRLLSLSERELSIAQDAKLSERQVEAVLRLPESGRETLITEAAARGLDDEQVERRVCELLELQYVGPTKRHMVVKDVRIFINTIMRAVEVMNEAGLDATAERRELSDCLEYTVRIPLKTATGDGSETRNA